MEKNKAIIYWAVLVGYYTGIFFLPVGLYVLALVLSFLPVLVSVMTGSFVYKEMVNYLSYNHAEAWAKISRERLEFYWYRRSILSFDKEVDDPDYEELRIKYRRVLRTRIFSACAYFVIFMYIIIRH